LSSPETPACEHSHSHGGGGPLLVFGAHPDDIEFGCGAVIAIETRVGRKAHWVVCSHGEAGTNGAPEERAAETKTAAAHLRSTVEFIELDGDSHLEIKTSHTIKLAEIIRRVRPSTVLATTCAENQHPDHSRLGRMVRDAARLARYGGLKELAEHKPHAIEQLFFYAVTPEGEPSAENPILVDISSGDIIEEWRAAMNFHQSQAATRNYVDLQLNRARLWGARAGVEFAMALFPSDLLVFDSLASAGKGARHF
jgi:LmbE family N-acetylglucosaminyl deacetylase